MKKKRLKFRLLAKIILVLLFILLMVLASLFFLAKATYGKSQQELAKGNLPEAYRLGQRAIKLNPLAPSYHLTYAQNNILMANSLALKIKNADKSDPKIMNDSAEIQQFISQGVREARRAVELSPNNSEYWQKVGDIYLSLHGIVQGSENWAISSYSKSLELNPNSPQTHLGLGNAYFAIKSNDLGMAEFEEAIRLKPDYPNAYFHKSWGLIQMGRLSEAEEVLKIGISFLDKNSDDYQKAMLELSKLLNAESLQNESSPSYRIPEIPLIQLP